MPESATLCPYCGVGCGLLVEVREGRVARVRGDPAHPSSLGDVCAKAVHLPPTLRTPDRLLYPHVRARRDGTLQRVPWELALRTAADRLGEIIAAHGPDAVAFYASGQLTTEEYYVADPRWTETADLADLHLALRPGSDVALLNAMLYVLVRERRLDRAYIEAHTHGWAEVEGAVSVWTPERAAAATGLSAESIVAAAHRFGRARAALTLWSMG